MHVGAMNSRAGDGDCYCDGETATARGDATKRMAVWGVRVCVWRRGWPGARGNSPH
jgi:hypothetical protein